MNRENLEKWLVDLETTEEPQTKYVMTLKSEWLTQPAGDCCLGRLCKVAIADGVPVTCESASPVVYYDNERATPPPAVLAWADVTPQFAHICSGKNDSAGLTFKEIAAWIRKEYT